MLLLVIFVMATKPTTVLKHGKHTFNVEGNVLLKLEWVTK